MVQVHVTPRGGECCSVLDEHLRLWPGVLARGDDPPEPPVPGFRPATRAGAVVRDSISPHLISSLSPHLISLLEPRLWHSCHPGTPPVAVPGTARRRGLGLGLVGCWLRMYVIEAEGSSL